MALADIILADGQGTPQNHTFTYISQVNNRVVRSDLAAVPETPLLLTLGHVETTKAGVKVGSHLWRVDASYLDADNVTVYSANIRVMMDFPLPVLTDARIDDLSAFVRNAMTQTFTRAWAKKSVG